MKHLMVSFLLLLFSSGFCLQGQIPHSLRSKLREFPSIEEFLINARYDEEIPGNHDDVALFRFKENKTGENLYVAWSRSGVQHKINGIRGFHWVFDTSQYSSRKPVAATEIVVGKTPVFIKPAADHSPVIDSVYVAGIPVEPFPSDGDLWLSTWATDGNVYSAWGDGKGPLTDDEPIPWVDCGIAKLSGTLPYVTPATMYRDDPAPPLENNDKPSSLLYIDSCLYGHFHSPLGDARIGYLARSHDYGKTWQRIGYFAPEEKQPDNASPWTKTRNSPFRCMFFINMGKAYNLNADGYIYALGIGTEWHWMQLGVYLVRVKKARINRYDAYEYFMGLDADGSPIWSEKQEEAIPLKGLITMGQGSAMYHPGIRRYLFLTDKDLFDAPFPWGPWTYAGSWTTWMNRPGRKEWQGGYQPGIISKDAGIDSFWFTLSGQNKKPYITYRLNLGKMVMILKQNEPAAK